MRVKMLRTRRSANAEGTSVFYAGHEYTVDPETGRALLAADPPFAEEVESVERAVVAEEVETPETPANPPAAAKRKAKTKARPRKAKAKHPAG